MVRRNTTLFFIPVRSLLTSEKRDTIRKIFTEEVLRKSYKLISNDFICLRKSFAKNFC